jgi:hypothetical protein
MWHVVEIKIHQHTWNHHRIFIPHLEEQFHRKQIKTTTTSTPEGLPHLVLLGITFACKFAAFCSHHRHKLWVYRDKWSAQPTIKPNNSASSTKGCEQPNRVRLKPGYISNSILAIMLIFLLSNLLDIAEETLVEFMSKATGTAVNWVQMVGMKVMYLFFR